MILTQDYFLGIRDTIYIRMNRKQNDSAQINAEKFDFPINKDLKNNEMTKQYPY